MKTKKVKSDDKMTQIMTLMGCEEKAPRIFTHPHYSFSFDLTATNPNKIFNREYITNLLWPNVHVQNQNIDTHLSNLRKKLHPFSKKIKTIKSRGYILRI